MPNHCFNTLICEDADFSEIIEQFRTKGEDEHDFLDFDKIIPMPKELEITASFNTKDTELQEQYKINTEKFGFPHWYEWRKANWGTKWNSYNCDFKDNSVTFSTAWCPPEPVIKELAKITGKTFVLEYIEDGDAFVGRYTASPDGVIDECYEIEDAPQELLDSVGYTPWDEDEEELELT